MTARDLLQRSKKLRNLTFLIFSWGITKENGDTIWESSPLVRAAIHGRLAILDGIHRLHKGTVAVLQRLSKISFNNNFF